MSVMHERKNEIWVLGFSVCVVRFWFGFTDCELDLLIWSKNEREERDVCVLLRLPDRKREEESVDVLLRCLTNEDRRGNALAAGVCFVRRTEEVRDLGVKNRGFRCSAVADRDGKCDLGLVGAANPGKKKEKMSRGRGDDLKFEFWCVRRTEDEDCDGVVNHNLSFCWPGGECSCCCDPSVKEKTEAAVAGRACCYCCESLTARTKWLVIPQSNNKKI